MKPHTSRSRPSGTRLTLVAILCAMRVLTPTAGAAVGDMAIYTHTSQNDNVVDPSPATYDLPWNTTVQEDSGYSLSGANVTAEAGHHLVLHSAFYYGGQRRAVQQQILVNGSAIPAGWGYGHTRGTAGADEAIPSAGAIVELTSVGTISVRAFRTDTDGTDDVDRYANASGLQLLRLPDTWDYCRLSKGTDQTGPSTTTYVPVTYDEDDELGTDSFGHTSGSADITLKQAGYYLVFVNTYTQMGNNRVVLVQRLTLDGSPIDGSYSTAYFRDASINQGSTTIGIIIKTTSDNQVLNVEGRLSAALSSTYKADRTAVTIAKLPDTGEYIRLDDAGADNWNPPDSDCDGVVC